MQRKFLATTRLKSGWPLNGPDVFLGGWCLHFKEEAAAYPNAVMPPYPWTGHEARTEGLQYCADTITRVVRGLSPFFSELLRVPLDERETRLLLGAIVGRIIIGTRHNFVCLQDVVERYGPLQTVGVRKEDYVVPVTSEALVTELRRDAFQLQLISEICPLLEIAIEYEPANEDRLRSGAMAARTKSLGDTLRNTVKALARRQSHHAQCLLYNSTFSLSEVFALVLRSGFRVGMHPLVRYDTIEWPRPDAALRQELESHMRSFLGADLFEQAICKIVPSVLPVSLLEGLGVLNTIAADNFPAPPKTIVSANAWNNDDAFRLWAINALKRGSRLVSCQHGGAYGKRLLPGVGEGTEIAVVDRFISWGGSGQQARSTATLPIPPHYLVNRSGSTDDSILYIGTTIDRWPFSIAHYPIGPMFFDYLDRQVDFWNALSPDLRPNVLMRPNPGDAGWSEMAQLRRRLPELPMDDFSASFPERLRKARVAVVDNLSTTFVQSMGSDVPTILVWDPDIWAVNEEAGRHFSALEKAGVYHRSPKAAASALARVWADPQGWWQSPDVAGPVKSFLNRYVMRAQDWASPWLRELLA